MLIVYFDFNNTVHHKFLPQGQVVYKKYYLQVQPRLWK